MSAGSSAAPPTAQSIAESPSKHGHAESGAAQPAPVRAGCEPIALDGDGEHAVLLLHGFGDTPQTLAYLAAALHETGFAAHAPLLPGHGRSIEDFDRSTADQWLAAARDALAALEARYPRVGVVGLSMGGAITVLLAAESSRVPAVVLIAPYARMPRWVAALARSHRVWGRFAGVIHSRSNKSIRDPQERSRNLGYGMMTARVLNELRVLAGRARRALPRVTAPTLVIQSAEDNRLPPAAAHDVMRRLGAREKRLLFTAGAGHIITVDYGRDAVIAEVRAWLAAHLGSGVRSGTLPRR